MALTAEDIKRMISENIPQEQGLPPLYNSDGTVWYPHYVHVNQNNFHTIEQDSSTETTVDGLVFAGLIVKITPDLPDDKVLLTQ